MLILRQSGKDSQKWLSKKIAEVRMMNYPHFDLVADTIVPIDY